MVSENLTGDGVRRGLDLPAKKKILRTIPYGLYALTSAYNDELNVFTATWVSQCSFEPPLLMVAVRKDSYSHDMIRNGGVFALNFVGKDDADLLAAFFKTVRRVGNKLGDAPFRIGATGAPLLDAAISALECRVTQFHEAGDHSVVIGEVVAAHLYRDESPLICSDTSWHYAG
ncbi:MAG TPA: flavin reductase family protein [Armatimonadota bacterium]|nr:flavin reductase family protein [Armatimonadota bacterium]